VDVYPPPVSTNIKLKSPQIGKKKKKKYPKLYPKNFSQKFHYCKNKKYKKS